MSADGRIPDFDTVILAGGRAARMTGADKAALVVGAEPMLVSVARAAAAAGTGQLIVVGPSRSGAVGLGLRQVAAGLPRGLMTVREEPPGAGPVPALRCGVTAATAPWIALLAADLPFLTGPWLARLVALAWSSSHDRAGAMLVDDDERPQWLTGCWHAGRLRSALDGYQGDSLGGLLGPIRPALLRPGAAEHGGPPPWQDCDSPEDLAAVRAAAGAVGPVADVGPVAGTRPVKRMERQ